LQETTGAGDGGVCADITGVSAGRLGVLNFHAFFLAYSSVYTASREAPRFASSVGGLGQPNYLQCAEIANVSVDMGFFGGVNFEDVM